MAALSPNMFADMVVPVMEMLRDASIEPDAFDPALQTGFKRPLRTVVPGVSDEAPSISIQWREVHHNTRVVNLLLSAALVGNRFTCVDRYCSSRAVTCTCFVTPCRALKTRVRTRLQVLRQHGGTDADKTWRRIVDTDPVAGFEPSWFIERIAEDEITPDPGDSLCVKLWRDAGASRLLLGDAFVRRRAVVKLFTELEARQRGSLTGATKASGQRMSIFDATEKMTPSTLSIKLRSPSDETQVAADVTLEIARINRAFTIFEYITAGMMLDLTIAIDAHAPGVGTGLARAANANPCLMALDPIVHLLAPHCSRICPIGFVLAPVSSSSPARRPDAPHRTVRSPTNRATAGSSSSGCPAPIRAGSYVSSGRVARAILSLIWMRRWAPGTTWSMHTGPPWPPSNVAGNATPPRSSTVPCRASGP